MKHLIKVDYCCEKIRTGGKWFFVDSKEKPRLGVIKENYLHPHNCKRYLESQDCEENESCNLQEILEIKPYSEKK